MSRYVLAIDQGTTSSRAILFDQQTNVVASGQQEFPQHFPASGWVEHNPEDIWTSTIATCKEAIENAGADISDIVAIGITNQRETTIVWDRETGEPLYNAIVWRIGAHQIIVRNLKAKVWKKLSLQKPASFLIRTFPAPKSHGY